MGLLRGIGYFFCVLIVIGGIITLPYGIAGILVAIALMWLLHKGGQVTSLQKDVRALRLLQEENARKEFEQERRDALRKQAELDANRTIKLDTWSEVGTDEKADLK